MDNKLLTLAEYLQQKYEKTFADIKKKNIVEQVQAMAALSVVFTHAWERAWKFFCQGFETEKIPLIINEFRCNPEFKPLTWEIDLGERGTFQNAWIRVKVFTGSHISFSNCWGKYSDIDIPQTMGDFIALLKNFAGDQASLTFTEEVMKQLQ